MELDEHNATLAGQAAEAAGLDRVESVIGDASMTDAYAGAVPADLILLCGVFGNIGEDDIANTIGHLPSLCATGATAIWTRHRHHPDITPSIRETFARAGFDGASGRQPVAQPCVPGVGLRCERFERWPAELPASAACLGTNRVGFLSQQVPACRERAEREHDQEASTVTAGRDHRGQ